MSWHHDADSGRWSQLSLGFAGAMIVAGVSTSVFGGFWWVTAWIAIVVLAVSWTGVLLWRERVQWCARKRSVQYPAHRQNIKKRRTSWYHDPHSDRWSQLSLGFAGLTLGSGVTAAIIGGVRGWAAWLVITVSWAVVLLWRERVWRQYV